MYRWEQIFVQLVTLKIPVSFHQYLLYLLLKICFSKIRVLVPNELFFGGAVLCFHYFFYVFCNLPETQTTWLIRTGGCHCCVVQHVTWRTHYHMHELSCTERNTVYLTNRTVRRAKHGSQRQDRSEQIGCPRLSSAGFGPPANHTNSKVRLDVENIVSPLRCGCLGDFRNEPGFPPAARHVTDRTT